MTVAPNPSGHFVLVRADRVIAMSVGFRVMIYFLCVGGTSMGVAVARAPGLRAADFTALSGLPGWPEVWGVILAGLGAACLMARLTGDLTRFRRGNTVSVVAMAGMCAWYAIFAASLVLGTATYGEFPYLTLSAMHGIGACLVWRTDAFSLPTQGVT